jgi:hypothetical protein
LELSQQTGILEGIANIKPLLPISDALFFLYVNANARQKTVGTLKGVRYQIWN